MWGNFFITTLFLVGTAAHGAPLTAYRLPAVPVPGDNPQTKEKIQLGKQLFFDPRLSITGTVSCASCHSPMLGGVDSRVTSTGVRGQVGGRNSPTVFGAAYLSVQFWDGRAKSLEDQAKGPLTNPIEMGMKSHADVVAVVKKIPGYLNGFAAAFPSERDPVNIDNLAKAIASFERELIPTGSPFDRFIDGDAASLDESAKRGFALVESIGCTSCHSGPAFAGKLAPGPGTFRTFPVDTSSAFVAKYELDKDKGKDGKNLWRVPSLRNVAATAPYFHNGKVADLREAIRVMAETQLSTTLKDEEVDDIFAFLVSLTGEAPPEALTAPILPPTPGTSVVLEPGN